MTDIDVALISASNIKNDCIELMRKANGSVDTRPHEQLVKLFEHYIYLFTLPNENNADVNVSDTVVKNLVIIMAYQQIYGIYGERGIYKDKIERIGNKDVFYDEFLLRVDPMLAALAFNSVSYLYFCTKEFSVVKKIVDRLLFLSDVWHHEYLDVHTLVTNTIPFPFIPNIIEVHSPFVRYVNLVSNVSEIDSGDDSIQSCNFIPLILKEVLHGVFVAYMLIYETAYKNAHPDYYYYGSMRRIPMRDLTIYFKSLMCGVSNITGLLKVLSSVTDISFDLKFVLGVVDVKCTIEEFCEAIKQNSAGYNHYVWLILCYMYTHNKLHISSTPCMQPFRATMYDNVAIGPVMFNYIVLGDKESLIKFLKAFQFKRNRSMENDSVQSFIQLLSDYRRLDMGLDVKKLKIQRGVLLNLLSAGYGDILCVNPIKGG